MIKTGVWVNREAPAFIIVAVLGAVLVGALAPWFRGSDLPTPLELLVLYPVTMISGFLMVVLSQKIFFKKSDVDWKELGIPMLFGLILGLIIYLSGLWSGEAASVPLDLSGIGQYLISLGVFPFTAGPGAILRGFAWGTAIALAIKTYKNNADVLSAVIRGIVYCVAINLVFLLPYMIIYVLVFLGKDGNGGLFMNVFADIALNAYWNNAQIIRWFTGFGGQTANSWLLVTASWTLVINFVIWIFLLAKSIQFSVITNKLLKNIFGLVFAVFVGMVAAWGRGIWGLLDMSAILIAVEIIICGLLLQFDAGELSGELRSWLLYFFLLGSFILGWPVLLAAVAWLSAIYLQKDNQFLKIDDKFNWLKKYLVLLMLTFFVFEFVRRGGDVDLSMTGITVAFSFFGAIYFYALQKLPDGKIISTWIVKGIWLLVSIIIAVMFKTFLPVAIMLLGGVIVFMQNRLKGVRPDLTADLILLSGAIMLFMMIFLPKLLNPRLLPM